ncbi:uncharacterized protein TNCV_3826481 [Trichonephila clavipes]|nr:uncharacterized protein TNCV_3826481 [Trichonephila clavipes]
MNVCKCIVPSRHGGTPNSRRATSPLVRLVEGEERWDTPDHPQGVFPQNWGKTVLNRSVTCMVFKAKANDMRHFRTPFAMMNFVGLDLAIANQQSCRVIIRHEKDPLSVRLAGLDALGKIKVPKYEFRIRRAQVPPSGKETRRQNFLQ